MRSPRPRCCPPISSTPFVTCTLLLPTHVLVIPREHIVDAAAHHRCPRRPPRRDVRASLGASHEAEGLAERGSRLVFEHRPGLGQQRFPSAPSRPRWPSPRLAPGLNRPLLRATPGQRADAMTRREENRDSDQTDAQVPGTLPRESQVSSTQVKILVPGNHLMVGLLGQRDELLRTVEAALRRHADPCPRQRDHRRGARGRTGGPPFRGARLLARTRPLARPDQRGAHDRDGEGRRAALGDTHRRGRPVGQRPQGAPEDGRDRSVMSTPSQPTRSPLASALPAPASRTSPSPSPCRRSRPKRWRASY